MAKRLSTHFVITANLTDTGAPAYLTRDGGWSGDLQKAFAIETESERDSLLAGALREERVVCDPYFFEAGLAGSTIDPLSVKEHIRAEGPSTRIRRPD